MLETLPWLFAIYNHVHIPLGNGDGSQCPPNNKVTNLSILLINSTQTKESAGLSKENLRDRFFKVDLVLFIGKWFSSKRKPRLLKRNRGWLKVNITFS